MIVIVGLLFFAFYMELRACNGTEECGLEREWHDTIDRLEERFKRHTIERYEKMISDYWGKEIDIYSPVPFSSYPYKGLLRQFVDIYSGEEANRSFNGDLRIADIIGYLEEKIRVLDIKFEEARKQHKEKIRMRIERIEQGLSTTEYRQNGQYDVEVEI